MLPPSWSGSCRVRLAGMESGLAGPGLRLVWAWQLRGAAACFNTVAAEMRSHLAGLYGDHAPSLLRGLVVRVKRKVRGCRRSAACHAPRLG